MELVIQILASIAALALTISLVFVFIASTSKNNIFSDKLGKTAVALFCLSIMIGLVIIMILE